MTPVRGSGWYKRPYRLRYELQGRVVNKAFHNPRRRQEEMRWLRRNNVPFKAWTITDGRGRAIDIVPRALIYGKAKGPVD